MPEQRAIVVGSGLAGLVAGCTLVDRGIETTILEKNPFVGGYNSCYAQGGYRLDVGATMLQTPEVLEETLELIGAPTSELTLLPLEKLYGVKFSGDRELEFLPSVEGTAESIAKLSSKDAVAFRRYIADFDEAKRTLKRLLIDEAGARHYLSPEAARLLRALNPLRSSWHLVSRYFKTYEVRAAMGFQSLYLGTPPNRCPSVYASIPYFEVTKGVWHIQGGLHRLSSFLATVFTQKGGILRTRSEVDRILVRNGRATGARLVGGEVVDTDLVVANTEATYTYTRLIPKEALSRFGRWRIRHLTRACSAQIALFGTGTANVSSDQAHHTFYIPSDLTTLCRQVFDQRQTPNEFFAYICCPTVTDPTVAPKGRSSIYVLLLRPAVANGGPSPAGVRSSAEESVLRALEERGVLHDRSAIEMSKVFTPSDFSSTFNQPGGMTFGIAPTLSQVGKLRPAARSPFVKGLYLAGASTNPGCGIPSVLSSGRAAGSAALEDVEARAQTVA